MEIRIKYGRAPEIIGDGGGAMPLPIGYKVNPLKLFNVGGSIKVRFSLCSTAGGGSSWNFYDIPNIEDYLTWGWYNPNFYAMVDEPIIWWDTYRDKIGEIDLPRIVQKYKPGYNPFIHSVGVAGKFHPCYENQVLAKVLANKVTNNLDFRQGSLCIYQIAPNDEINQKCYTQYPFEFLNHQVLGGRIIAKRRDESTLYGLVKMHREGVVVSIDHIKDPIYLKEGLYLFWHPEPSDKID